MFVGPELGRGAVQLLGGGAAGVLRQHAVRGSRGRGLLCRGQAGLLCADSEINMYKVRIYRIVRNIHVDCRYDVRPKKDRCLLFMRVTESAEWSES